MFKTSDIIRLMKKLDEILKELHPLEVKVLLAFKKKEILTMNESMDITKLSEGDSRRAIGWLTTKEIIEIIKQDTKTLVHLSELGKKYLEKGTPSKQIIEKIKAKDSVIIKNLDFLEPLELSEAIGFLKSKGIVKIEKGGVVTFNDKSNLKDVEHINELVTKIQDGININSLTTEDRKIIEERHRERGKSRGMFEITRKTVATFKITKEGKQLIDILHDKKLPEESISQLTSELIKSGNWREKEFREYNIELSPPRIVTGKAHPYQEFLNQVRNKLTSMGFCEVSGEIVETEFWNMDALFMPQFHPAREVHDVYFMKSPKCAKEIDSKFLTAVAQTHQNGGLSGSKGWGYKFDSNRAKRFVLRSHGTVLSVRTLAKYPEPPGKYFTIARCFRPDDVDATHAPDFFQIDGIVLANNINFRALLGLLKLFGTEIAGASEIKFTPAYFPFTEPSVELHAKHPKLGWIELGGAGIFRPEVTTPLGVKVPVIAWGMGLDRMAMMALGIHDIRDLFSRDLEFLRKMTD